MKFLLTKFRARQNYLLVNSEGDNEEEGPPAESGTEEIVS